MMPTWHWCLVPRGAAERPTTEPADRRPRPAICVRIPYPRDAAEHWKERVDARNEAWDAADKEWDGDED